MDKCREAFEKAYSAEFPNSKVQLLPNGRYSGWIKQNRWESWQSRQAEIDEKDKRITNQKDFIEIALITLNHLKENAVTHRDYGHECNWVRSFNDLIKLASDAEDSLNEALRGNDA